jgi:hypothetical protein
VPRFGLNPRPYADPKELRQRRYLLWPVFAWRVVAPEPRERRLSLLEKHVLGLCGDCRIWKPLA